jgi:hypothetical protein
METGARIFASPAHVTIKQLSSFVAVAEDKNFHRATGRLHMSQP